MEKKNVNVDCLFGENDEDTNSVLPETPKVKKDELFNIGKTNKTMVNEVSNLDVMEAIKGTYVGYLVDKFASVANPPLPIELTLPKALTTISTYLSCPRDGWQESEDYGIYNAKVAIRSAGTLLAPNIYTVCIAPASAGKNICRMDDDRLFADGICLGNGGTKEGLYDAIMDIGYGRVILAEMSSLLDNNNSNAKGYMSALTEMFDSGKFSQTLSKRSKVPERKSKYSVPNLIAYCQPEMWNNNASSELEHSGFISRCLITHLNKTDYWKVVDNCRDYKEEIKHISLILKSLNKIYDQDFSFFDKIDMEFHENYGTSSSSRLAKIMSRKLCVILQPDGNDITLDTMKRVEVLLYWFMRNNLKLTYKDNSKMFDKKDWFVKVLDMIKKKKNKFQLTIRDLQQGGPKNKFSKDYKDAIDYLVEEGLIETYCNNFIRYIEVEDKKQVLHYSFEPMITDLEQKLSRGALQDKTLKFSLASNDNLNSLVDDDEVLKGIEF